MYWIGTIMYFFFHSMSAFYIVRPIDCILCYHCWNAIDDQMRCFDDGDYLVYGIISVKPAREMSDVSANVCNNNWKHFMNKAAAKYNKRNV